VIVKPETIIGWHRRGSRLFWTWKSRHGKRGRPAVVKELRQLIRRMSRENPLWGAPKIHGELLKLGIEVSESTVSKYLVRLKEWTAQQLREAFPWDTAPRLLLRDRDRIFGHEFVEQIKAMGIEEVLWARRSPWQRAYVERLIGTIRRECLDHVIVFNANCLRRHVQSFTNYYHRSRTHLSLEKDSPEPRPIQPRSSGQIIAIPEVVGLHHRYERRAA
jgi:putative transposase